MVTLLADLICDLEKEQLFGQINRKITLLLMNYVTSYFGSPIIVFKPEEKSDYLDGISHVMKMRLLLAKKVRETVFSQGILMEKVGEKCGTDKYKSQDPILKETTVEWGDLVRAELEWKKLSNLQK